MPMPPMPGMGMLHSMSMMPGGPPPPGMHMGMEAAGLAQDDHLQMAQQRAAIVLQHEVRVRGTARRQPLKHSVELETQIVEVS